MQRRQFAKSILSALAAIFAVPKFLHSAVPPCLSSLSDGIVSPVIENSTSLGTKYLFSVWGKDKGGSWIHYQTEVWSTGRGIISLPIPLDFVKGGK